MQHGTAATAWTRARVTSHDFWVLVRVKVKKTGLESKSLLESHSTDLDGIYELFVLHAFKRPTRLNIKVSWLRLQEIVRTENMFWEHVPAGTVPRTSVNA